MTREKEGLVLSGALTRRQSRGSFLALLTEGIGEGVIDGFITKTVIPAGVGKPARGGRKKKAAAPLRDLKGFEARWRAREDRWVLCRERSLYLTPPPLDSEGAPPREHVPHPRQGAREAGADAPAPGVASQIGRLVHKVL